MVRSHAAGDDPQFYAVALQVAARAARQGHHRIAAELKDLVEQAREKSPATVTAIARPRGDLADLVTASFPEVGLDDLVIRDEIRSSLEQVVLEQRQRHALVEKGFAPSHRLLLEGPPGTGKTMTAGVLAHELSLPLLTIRLDSVFSRFMGETSSKLRVLFDAVEHQRAVYLFDEFDALGADRSGNDVGEARRILNSFLVFLEQSGPESIVIASTNHRTLLDRALFRRFDLVITYELPDEQASAAVLKARLGPLGKGIRWTSVQRHTDGLSHAELVKAAEAAAKRSLLAGQDRVSIEVLRDALADRRQGARA
jgi:SpoVK/Ycf46/Vps4 family AAA+-type ATPase